MYPELTAVDCEVCANAALCVMCERIGRDDRVDTRPPLYLKSAALTKIFPSGSK